MLDHYRKTQISLNFLILSLYGQSDYGLLHSSHDISDAKKLFLKILKSISIAVEETIKIVDDKHKQNILSAIKKYEKELKSLKSFDDLDQSMISCQSELIFLLIGLMPHRSSENRVTNYNRSSWKLDDYRQIQYVQNSEQKRRIIFGVIYDKYLNRFGSWTDFLANVYNRQCNRNPEKLVLWIKKNHPDIYHEIF